MAGTLSVRLVQTKHDTETFVKFPWKLYRDDPYWVPPLLSTRRFRLDRAKNPTWQYLDGDFFVAWRGDEPVGTIAAFVNHRHNAYQREHIGFFGQFEVIDDATVAQTLLSTAADYVATRGYSALRGPANFTMNDECGVLLSGFNDPPVPLMPYNPPYYQHLIEATPGFAKVMDLTSYSIRLHAAETSRKLDQARRVTARNNRRRGITVRHIDRHHRRRDLAILAELYNTAWDNNWGFVPLSESELHELVKDLARYLEPRLSFIAEVHGRPAGLLLAFPDTNQPLLPVRPRPGKPEIVSMVQVFWHWKVRPKINRIRVPLMGVLEPYRGQGVESALFMRLYEQAVLLTRDQRWEYADAGWVLDANAPMQRMVEAYAGVPYKRYRIYERTL